MPEKPEITLLKCQSEITACVFHPFEPSIVIGGTYSGQLVKWDTRTGKSFPIAKSLESTNFLIKSINIVSPQNIISVSSDGTLVDWGDDVKQPIKTIKLSSDEDDKNTMQIHTVQFPQGDTNNFYIGSEDNMIYQGKVHAKDRQKPIEEQFMGH